MLKIVLLDLYCEICCCKNGANKQYNLFIGHIIQRGGEV